MPGYLREADIKYDMPPSDVAIKRVTYNLRVAKQLGAGAVKFIHGYGSTGRGGKIRTEVRRYLADKKRRGQIRDFVAGEDFSIFDESTRRAFALCDDLRRDRDLERHNNGVTFAVL
jgi:hypothetical protein